MKLVVFASLSDTATANYFISALRKSGHELLVCSDLPASGVDRLASGLVDVRAILQAHNFAAEALVFFEGGTMRLLPDTTRCDELITAWYAIDTHMDFAKHVRIGRLFDLTCVAQTEHVPQLAASGVTQAIWLPLAFAPEILPKEDPARELDLAYVGSDNKLMHPERSAMLAALAAAFPAHSFGRATPHEMGQIYSRAKIVFNRAVNNDVNMRVFEAMGAGAVLLTDRVVGNGMEELFDEDTHYVTYRNHHDLIDVVGTLLADPARMQTIGQAAKNWVMEYHTYQDRAERMVAMIAGSTKTARPQPADLFAACLVLGLGKDAVRSSARAIEQVGGGRLQRALGRFAACWIGAAAIPVGAAEWLRSRLSKARHV